MRAKQVPCKVCGLPLLLTKQSVYRVPVPRSVAESLAGVAPEALECVDCLTCGCQNVLNTRKLHPGELPSCLNDDED